MFRIEMLPAEYGDCLWIEYGSADAPRRVLVDGGTPGVFKTLQKRIEALAPNERRFELFVVTHIDADHIGGALGLLKARRTLGVEFDDVWFNGYVHLDPDADDVLGPVQGEQLTEEIVRQRLPWNAAFDGKTIVVPDAGVLPRRTLPGGLTLTLLSPYRRQLDALQPVWEKVVREAGLVPGAATDETLEADEEEDDDTLGPPDVDLLLQRPFKGDAAEANGSSVALLAEFEGWRCLLGADAYAPVLLRSLERLAPEGRVTVDVFKLAHHGSRANVNMELLKKLECSRFLVSTNGKKFKHPDKEALARVIRHGTGKPALLFNYRTGFNHIWDDTGLMQQHGYKATYPPAGIDGLAVEL